MKKLYFLCISMISLFTFGQDLVITGIIDGPLPGGTPKGLELFVVNNIPDLSIYGLESTTNGAAAAGEEYTFPNDAATAGTFIYVATEAPFFTQYFGIAPTYTNGVMGVNGDDTVILYKNGAIEDSVGEIGVDGSGTVWDHLDGWVYRIDGFGPNPTFDSAEWTYSGINALDGCDLADDTGTNAGCASVFPIGTYSATGSSCGISFDSVSIVCSTNTFGDNNDGVTVNISYSGVDAGITSVTTNSGGTVGGDDPSSVADGTISITGLSEGDSWDLILNGGDCDGTTTSGNIGAAECDPTPNTCFDLSAGAELLELVPVTLNNGFNNNGVWENNGGVYSANGFCGGGCAEQVESWLVFGPLDMSSVADLTLAFDASENFGTTDLIVAYTTAYSGCPSTSSWTTAQTITDPGAIGVDLSAVTGTDVFIGIQYEDDGSDGYSAWELSNVALEAFGPCPILGTRPTSSCAICDLILNSETYVCSSNTAGDNNDGVTIEIPYSGLEDTITSLSTTSAGTIGGDDPSATADGTITITGLSEGDAWDLTINGGDCDGTSISGTIPSAFCDPVTTDLIINEFLADPDAGTGDANGDGVVNTSEDEFIEFNNIGASPLDISGYTYEDGANIVRHTFPPGTVIPAGGFLTLFGGGMPTGIDGISQTATSGAVGLNNGGDTITVFNSSGAVVVTLSYGSEAGNNQSLAREPDFTGNFVQHLSHTTNPVQFSPGERNDGLPLSNEDFELENMRIFPNPVTDGHVSIIAQGGEEIAVEVFNILGENVLKTKVNPSTRLNISNLKTGIYIIKLTQNTNSVTKKLLIK